MSVVANVKVRGAVSPWSLRISRSPVLLLLLPSIVTTTTLSPFARVDEAVPLAGVDGVDAP